MDFREETKKIPLLIGTVLGEFDFGPAISGKYEFTRKEVEEKVRDVLGEEGIELIDEFLKIYPDKAPMDLLSVDTIFREPTNPVYQRAGKVSGQQDLFFSVYL